MIRNIESKLRNIIKQAYLRVVDLTDSSSYPSAEAGLDKLITRRNTFTRLSVYGVVSNPTKDSHVLLLSSQGQESVKFGIVNDFINRKKGLKEGEVGLHNSKKDTYILLNDSGNAEIIGSGDFAVRYNALETAFNQLKADFDALVVSYNLHTHPTAPLGPVSIPSVLGTVSTADITPAKIDEIEVPN